MNDTQQDVIISTKTGEKSTIGLITLNRPSALNALNLPMIKSITAALVEWGKNPNIAAVVIQGASEKAFCAGGDIKSLYLHGKENPDECMSFFYHEYRLNNLIKNYSKPYIALLHGITMGGGIGVSVHGSHKVAAHNLVFAMPESSIGFFTDVGASYFLSRCKDYTGIYMALTGNKISCLDAAYIELVNHVLKDSNYTNTFSKIIDEILNTKFKINNLIENSNTISNILVKYSMDINYNGEFKNNLINNLDFIKNNFNQNSISAIYNKLIQDKSELANKTIETLNSKSPTSLLVNFELIKRGFELDFSACMKMEYAVAYGFLTHNDFYEGVRAVIIDKDNKPKWANIDINKDHDFDYRSYFNNNYSDKLELF